MDMKYKIALLAVPALLMFAGVVVAAHDGVLTAKDVSEVSASDTGNENTIKGKVVFIDDSSCSSFHTMTGGTGDIHCFVLESTQDGIKKYSYVSQVDAAPALGETVIASGKLRVYYDLESGDLTWDAFGTTGTMNEKQAGQVWKSEGNPYAELQPAAMMWLDATDYHESWFF